MTDRHVATSPIQAMALSSLAKVRPDGPGPSDQPLGDPSPAYLFGGGHYAFQLALKLEHPGAHTLDLTWDALPEGVTLTVRKVMPVPVSVAADPMRHDARYLDTEPGLYPDCLQEVDPRALPCNGSRWESYWIELSAADDAPEARLDLTFTLRLNRIPLRIEQGEPVHDPKDILLKHTLALQVTGIRLADRQLLHTAWFYADTLADYYGLEVWSEAHWDCVRRFLKSAVKRGVNLLLTPIFTPPLDTAVGTYRTCVQLVDVTREADGSYRFGFDRLRRWIRMAEAEGIRAFEMAHLFTQWGARACPQIRGLDYAAYPDMGRPPRTTAERAREEGIALRSLRSTRAAGPLDELPLLFGWDDASTGDAYAAFLAAFLPALMEVLTDEGVKDRSYFHISDEPNADSLDRYRACRELIEPYIEGRPVMDALSDFAFYEQGVTDLPIPSNDHIKPFLEHGVEHLWTYYCISQSVDVSNRFMAMPSARNRILGVQLYIGEIVGFLHWGFNFYLTQFSGSLLNPYLEPDAGGGFAAGDAFAVYPGADGRPEESIRWVVFGEALDDLRLLRMLEAKIGREAVLGIIRDTARELGVPEDEEIPSFDRYPEDPRFLLQLRDTVSARLMTEHR